MKKYLLLIGLLISSNLFAYDLSFPETTSGSIKVNIASNSVDILVVMHKDGANAIAPGAANYESGADYSAVKPSQLTGEGNLVVFKGKDKSSAFTVKGLSPETMYAFDVYESGSKTAGKSFKKSTLATEPMLQVKGIAFSSITKSSMTVLLSKGNGKRRMIVARESIAPELPVDGKDYKPNSNFGKGDKTGADSYVIMLSTPGTDDNSIKVEGLEPGTKYCFTALEANGSGESINYNLNINKGNKVFKITPPEAPKALGTDEAVKNSFTAKWNEAKGALSYELDVATDKEFKNLVGDYTAMDVGKITNILVEDLPKAETYYYRLRTVGEGGLSENSNVIEVQAK